MLTPDNPFYPQLRLLVGVLPFVAPALKNRAFVQGFTLSIIDGQGSYLDESGLFWPCHAKRGPTVNFHAAASYVHY
jgi:hypothetical protein